MVTYQILTNGKEEYLAPFKKKFKTIFERNMFNFDQNELPEVRNTT